MKSIISISLLYEREGMLIEQLKANTAYPLEPVYQVKGCVLTYTYKRKANTCPVSILGYDPRPPSGKPRELVTQQ